MCNLNLTQKSKQLKGGIERKRLEMYVTNFLLKKNEQGSPFK